MVEPVLTFKKQFTSVFLPTMIFETGIGSITPMIPLSVLKLGGNAAVAALVVALLSIGQVVGDIPAGHLAQRLGDRAAMLYGAGVSLILLILCALAPNWFVFALAIFGLGAVNALFVLARQAYLTEVTPAARRSIALSTLGGMQRIGSLIGPFLGGATLSVLGVWFLKGADFLPAVYWLAALLVVVTGLSVYLVKELPSGEKRAHASSDRVRTRDLLKKNARMFMTLGVAIVLVGAVRQTSNVALPLWAAHIGLSAPITSYIYGFSGLLDAAFFYPAGRVMDRFGRLWVAIPSLLILGGSILFIPLTNGMGTLALVALVMGFGNAIGAGMIMTISADMAPENGRAQFLATCRLFGDAGSAAGPMLIAGGAAVSFLAAGIWLLGGCGLVAASIMGATLEKYSVHANQRTRLKHGLTKEGRKLT
ncbi:MAG: MFS transporter [Streptococcaceae bacterium]|jgi:MFS family permease|nr:MFS transporter [Streptococcaceae bacterium]